MTFDEISTKLPESFVRTHRSFIVNCSFVTKYNSTNIWLNYALEIPLSRTYKAHFFDFMTQVQTENSQP
jgi:DNA-binding LytR/AlgR family response regulator